MKPTRRNLPVETYQVSQTCEVLENIETYQVSQTCEVLENIETSQV